LNTTLPLFFGQGLFFNAIIMNDKYNHYKVTLEHVSSPKGEALHAPVEVVFDNHDNLFNIIDKLQERDFFGDPGQSAEFAIGLKMFSEVMLRNKENPLFEEMAPAFREFMKKLKSSI
jgi:DNA polymerase III epsilon subunit-like protein